MNQNNRILIVDVLRGFALLLIIIIHYVEHFEFFHAPQVNILFSPETDSKVMQIVFILISGKAYSVFALLFGFSFFIQLDRKAGQGIDFRGMFLWRLTVLLIIGFFHSLVYRGDILHMYAILGFPLVLLYKANRKLLLWLAIMLVLQLPTIWELIKSFTQPDYEYVQRIPMYWGEGHEAYANGSFWDVVKYNFWKGRVTVWAWTVYNGRYLQLFALYITGLLLGRARFFENIRTKQRVLAIVLIVSVLSFGLLKVMQYFMLKPELEVVQVNLIKTLLNSWANLTVTSFLVTSIILLYLRLENGYIFKLFSAYGKMSLSNYVFQAVSGVIMFYGFGLALYKYLGTTWSVLLGILFFFLQAVISKWWNERFYYGPLEWLWRALTFMDFRLKFKKNT